MTLTPSPPAPWEHHHRSGSRRRLTRTSGQGIMSRSTIAKSRSEKNRSSAIPASTPPAPLVDIVPGRFTETDWQNMVAAEDGESNVMDIMEDVVSQALDQCYRIHIDSQLLPFTIAQAKDAILQIIEWQFLIHDPGESNVTLDHSWQEDQEPKANITDSWAQGSVPVVRTPATPALEEQGSWQEPPGDDLYPEVEDGPTRSRTGREETCGGRQQGLEGPQCTTPLGSQLMGLDQDLEQVETEPVETSTVNESEKAPGHTGVRKKSCSFKARRCLRKVENLQDISKSLDETDSELSQQPASEVPPEVPLLPCKAYWMPFYLQSMLKIERSRQPSNNSVTFDEFGNVTSVRRLDPGQFRRHQVKPTFQLVEVDPDTKTCRPAGSPPLRPLVFRSGHFGKRPIPDRYNTGRGRQPGPGKDSGPGALGRATGRQPIAGPITVQRLKLPSTCAASKTPEFPEFIPDGTKDRNHSKCGRYPEYEEAMPSQLKPIGTRLLVPPVPVEQLASTIAL